MRLTLSTFCRRRSRPRRPAARWDSERFETRCLLNAVWPAVSEASPNDTLDLAEDLGPLVNDLQVRRSGAIGDAPTAAADVDWYQFTLEEPGRVTLMADHGADNLPPEVCLSLYNTSPFTGEDLQNVLGHRLIAQSENDGHSDNVRIERVLGAGTYDVAVSGAGNHAFHPFLAGSGLPGSLSEYELLLTSSSLDLGADDGPVVLTTDPAIDSSLSSSPFVIRVDLSRELDPSTIFPDETVQVISSPDSDFSNGDEVSVPLAMFSFSSSAGELQLMPSMPLPRGYYQVSLAGNQEAWPTVLTDLNGVPLGKSADFPQGQDFSFHFQVAGVEGTTGDVATADDTPATAHELGNLTEMAFVQASGAIGDDPYYDPNIDWLLNPANDVDLYHFQVTGDGNHALTAEVFAGRIGSPLDPGVSLFRLDPSDGSLQFVGGDNNTFNPTLATNGTLPLFTDATLFAGLTAGDYYVAVSSAFNTPAPAEGQPVGGDGIFDPSLSHSGSAGGSTGRYLLNLQLTADSVAPFVTETTPSPGTTLTDAPTHLVIGFSEPVNLQQLAFQAFQQTSQTTVASVFIQAADGTRFSPRLESYDPTTNQANFLMLDGLASGTYELHLSGALGLTDFAGNPLTGNDPSGDYVVTFEIRAAVRGTEGDATQWTSLEPNDDPASPQELGVLFPHEIRSGITVTREPSSEASDTADNYRLEVLQRQDYFLSLTGSDLPAHIAISVVNAAGDLVQLRSANHGKTVIAPLNPGNYVIEVSGWQASDASNLQYQLHLTLLEITDNPPPLTSGPGPALQLRLAGTTPLPTTPPQVALFGNTGPTVVDTSGNGGGGDSTSQTPSTSSTTSTPPTVPTNFQVPTTSLVAFSERLVGGVGIASNVIASTGGQRVVLRLPEWFEWAGSRDLAFVNISSNVRERRLRDDADESTSEEVPQPQEEKLSKKTTSPNGDSSADDRSGGNSETTDPDLSATPPSPKATTPKLAPAEKAAPKNTKLNETSGKSQTNQSMSDASFYWLPAVAAAVSQALSEHAELRTNFQKLPSRQATRKYSPPTISGRS